MDERTDEMNNWMDERVRDIPEKAVLPILAAHSQNLLAAFTCLQWLCGFSQSCYPSSIASLLPAPNIRKTFPTRFGYT